MSEDKYRERNTIAVFQESLPYNAEPFKSYADKLQLSQIEVLDILQKKINDGKIRRFAGILKHNNAGFTRNAMVAIEVDDDICDETGAIVARFLFVSHCYQRKKYPDWPYSVYAMIHARSGQELIDRIEQVKNSISFKSVAVLPTVKEYKKSSFQIRRTDSVE